MRLIFVRHGETIWNLQRRYQGQTDIPMCAAGWERAKRLAQVLKGTRAAVVLSSPLRRALNTAEMIGEALGGPTVCVDPRLIEIDFGEWQGLTQTEVKQYWPKLLRRWKCAPDSVRFPRGESLQEAFARLQGFLRHPPCSAETSGKCVLAISHTGPIRLAGLIAEGRPLGHFRQVTVEPGALHAFDWGADGQLRRVSFGPPPQDRS